MSLLLSTEALVKSYEALEPAGVGIQRIFFQDSSHPSKQALELVPVGSPGGGVWSDWELGGYRAASLAQLNDGVHKREARRLAIRRKNIILSRSKKCSGTETRRFTSTE